MRRQKRSENWEVVTHIFQKLEQARRPHDQSVAICEEDAPNRLRAEGVRRNGHIFKEVFATALPKPFFEVHRAIGATVVRATNSCLENEAVGLTGGAIDGAFVAHGSTSYLGRAPSLGTPCLQKAGPG